MLKITLLIFHKVISKNKCFINKKIFVIIKLLKSTVMLKYQYCFYLNMCFVFKTFSSLYRQFSHYLLTMFSKTITTWLKSKQLANLSWASVKQSKMFIIFKSFFDGKIQKVKSFTRLKQNTCVFICSSRPKHNIIVQWKLIIISI